MHLYHFNSLFIFYDHIFKKIFILFKYSEKMLELATFPETHQLFHYHPVVPEGTGKIHKASLQFKQLEQSLILHGFS